MTINIRNLFVSGSFILHSNGRSNWKIDCDALSDEDIRTIAIIIVEKQGIFSEVYGIPTGGIRLADELKHYAKQGNSPILVVDDVLTTGNSMQEARANLPISTGFVIFARGEPPKGVRALFRCEHE